MSVAPASLRLGDSLPVVGVAETDVDSPVGALCFRCGQGSPVVVRAAVEPGAVEPVAVFAVAELARPFEASAELSSLAAASPEQANQVRAYRHHG